MNKPPIETQYKLNIIVLGESSVGKSTIVDKFVEPSIDTHREPTIGIDYKTHIVTTPDNNDTKLNTNTKLVIYDTAGQERFRSIVTAYYRNVCGAIIMFDMTDESTFDSVDYWINEVKSRCIANADVIIVGNKTDLEDTIRIDSERARAFCQSRACDYIECNRFDTSTIVCIFEKLVGHIFRNQVFGKCFDINMHHSKPFIQISEGIYLSSFFAQKQLMNDDENENDGSQDSECKTFKCTLL